MMTVSHPMADSDDSPVLGVQRKLPSIVWIRIVWVLWIRKSHAIGEKLGGQVVCIIPTVQCCAALITAVQCVAVL